MIGDLIKPREPEGGGNKKRVKLYRKPLYKRKWVKGVVVLSLGGLFIGCLALLIILKPHRDKALSFDLKEMASLEKATIVYDQTGSHELGRIFFKYNREPVKFGEIPYHLIQALISAEDSRFFKHAGVDYIGILRAVLKNLQPGGYTQGASTITQQLARQSFGLKGKTISRKLTEAFLANRIEQHYSKNDILEMYLNRIFFGSGFYGIEAAAQGYFGKSARELTIDESAVLVGLIKSPNRLSPLNNPDLAKRERNYVLNRMRDEKKLTREECNRLKAMELKTSPKPVKQLASYEEAYIRQLVIDQLGYEEASQGGYRVYTTIDRDIQHVARESLKAKLDQVERETPNFQHPTYAEFETAYVGAKDEAAVKALGVPKYLQGAVMMINNKTGAIIAMVGGRDFRHSEYNRALQSKRPAGTAFSPFVYAAAFSDGDKFPGSIVSDSHMDQQQLQIGGELVGIVAEWGVENEGNVYEGDISARRALVKGKVAATVRMGNEAGLKNVAELASRAGIKSELKEYPSTFVGESEVKLSEMCLGYSVFPNKGERPEDLYIVETIRRGDTMEVVFQADRTKAKPVGVIDEIAAYQVHSCLGQVLTEGTGAAAVPEYGLADLRQMPVAGKTGTTYGYTDLWFMGYSSEVTCGVWVGLDAYGKPIYDKAFSNKVALPVWVDVMNKANRTYAPVTVKRPAGAETMEICTVSGLRATENCYESVPIGDGSRSKQVRTTFLEVIREGDKLQRYCEVHSDGGGGMRPDLGTILENTPELREEREDVGAEPVPIQGETILGMDPYRSVRPVLRAILPDEEGEEFARKAQVVYPTKMGSEKARIKLDPPPPLKIE